MYFLERIGLHYLLLIVRGDSRYSLSLGHCIQLTSPTAAWSSKGVKTKTVPCQGAYQGLERSLIDFSILRP